MAKENSAELAPRREMLGRLTRDFRVLYGYLWPYRVRFFTAVVASAVSMAFGLLFPFLIGRLLDAAIPAAIPSEVAAVRWSPTVNQAAVLLIGSLAVQAVMMFFSTYWFRQAGETAVMGLRRDLFGRLISLPMTFFGEHRVGALTSRLSNDLGLIQDTLTDTVPQMIRQTALLMGGVVFIAVTSARLSLVMISTFPVLIFLAVLFGRKIRGQARAAQDRLAESATVAEETLQGITNVKAFGNEAFEMERYGQGLQAYLETSLKAARSRSGLISFIILGIFGSIILIFWYGARLMQAGELMHGELTQFILYTMFVGGSVASFAEVFSQLQRTLGATERVQELIREAKEPGVDAQLGLVPERRLQGEVLFRNISFHYPSRPDVQVLFNVTLQARRGEKIAIVGPSGAGKSTLLALLLRFYEPQSGEILFDGVPSWEVPLPVVRGSMAFVPQEVLLFGSSIRENIAYGRPGASDEEIEAAARQANCHEFIEQLPERYETLVGERGVKLSGGQRQRIAIARAILRDPAVLILDEATSSLDSESEALIQQALETLMEGRTAFIIAHRLSTVRNVDRICVLDEGRVVECGTHTELMTLGGLYRRLSDLQVTES